MLPGTYPANYPGDDLAYRFFFTLHSAQWAVHVLNAEAEGFDAFATCTLPDPMLKELRTLVEIPVAGCGETCFQLAAEPARRFGMLVFIDRMAERYLEQIASLGLAGRCVGVTPVGFTFHDVLAAFDKPGPLIDRFRAAARRMIAAGAGAIVPGEIPLNVLLASEGVAEVDGVPLIDSLGATLRQAEAMVDQRAAAGPQARADGWSTSAPPRERVKQVLDFYGLGKHLRQKGKS
jgi:Asp/Glu/hydantoin racemase